MTDILSTIAAYARERVEVSKSQKPFQKMKSEAESICIDEPGFPFERALRAEKVAFICEVKKASPSKGIIDEAFPYIEIAREYEDAGAAAISVLTEPKWFLGSDEYLTKIRKAVKLPILRKDFTVDPYQIYEAKVIGADAVLLICAILDAAELKAYIRLADELGLSALVEAHTEEEVNTALGSGARMIGVNNRNLKTFEVDLNTSIRLRNLVSNDILFISESGIRTAEDIASLREQKVNGVLIGETFMKSTDKKRQLAELKGEV